MLQCGLAVCRGTVLTPCGIVKLAAVTDGAQLIQTREGEPAQAEPVGVLKRGSQTGHSGILLWQSISLYGNAATGATPRQALRGWQHSTQGLSAELSPREGPACWSPDISAVAPGCRCTSSLVRWPLNDLYKLGDGVDGMLSRWKYSFFFF